MPITQTFRRRRWQPPRSRCAIASGSRLPAAKMRHAEICGEIARQEDAKGEASVIGQGFKTSALQAALANGTCGACASITIIALL